MREGHGLCLRENKANLSRRADGGHGRACKVSETHRAKQSQFVPVSGMVGTAHPTKEREPGVQNKANLSWWTRSVPEGHRGKRLTASLQAGPAVRNKANFKTGCCAKQSQSCGRRMGYPFRSPDGSLRWPQQMQGRCATKGSRTRVG